MAVISEFPDIESSSIDYRSRFSGEVGKWFLDTQTHHTVEALKQFRCGKALDVGGGHGQNVGTLLELGLSTEIMGSTPSCGMLLDDYLKRGDIRFSTGSLLDIPYQDQSFDAVISFRMLAHLENWQQHIAELCRVSDNTVVVDFPTARSINFASNAFFSLKKNIEKNTRTYTVYHERDVVECFRQHGFVQDYRAGQFFLPMALYRASRSKKFSSGIEFMSQRLGLNDRFGSPLITSFQRMH